MPFSGFFSALTAVASDIADYASSSVRHALTDADKHSLATKFDQFRPAYRYEYPGREEYGKQWRFQFDWLQRFNWLAYSKRDNGGYCMSCILFGHGQDGGDLGILVSRPMVNFTKALSTTLPKHEQRESHNMAVTRLSDTIMGKLTSYGLDLEFMRGQCYDGAGNMAGKNVGAATLITKQHKLALYLHCTSHCLKLAVVNGLDNMHVRNMMDVVRRAGKFFDSHPKRQLALEKAIDKTEPEAKRKKLGDLCRTRWVQRLDALQTFQKMHLSVVTCMESICEEGPGKWSTDSLRDVSGLLLAITASEFISALVVTNKCLGYLRALTSSLQAEAKDVVQAVGDIDVVLTSLREGRNTIDQQHDAWFQEIELMCRSVDVVPSIPRRCGRQLHRNNIPADDPRTYYRRCISVPLVDHLLAELETRFSPHHRVALLGLCLIPSALVTLPDPDVKIHLAKLVDLYEEDLAFPESVSHQMVSWKIKWQQQMEQHGKACLPTSPSQALPHATSLYPDIRVLLLVSCTLPVTSCSSERSFSTLKRIKTYLRSTCGNERLTSLALMHIHRDVPVSSQEMVDKFTRLHPRRLKLMNID